MIKSSIFDKIDDMGDFYELTISIRAAEYNEKNLKVGNIIEIHNKNYVLSTPYKWENNNLIVRAYPYA